MTIEFNNFFFEILKIIVWIIICTSCISIFYLIYLIKIKNIYSKKIKEEMKNILDGISIDNIKTKNDLFIDLSKDKMQPIINEIKNNIIEQHGNIKELIKPLGDSLEKYENIIKNIEINRTEAYGRIHNKINDMQKAEKTLLEQTQEITNIFKNPTIKGQWGQIQLKNLIELTGMTEYCDFEQQPQQITIDDNRLIPDMIIRLPGNKIIIIDSKTPSNAYMEISNANTEEYKKQKLTEHIKQIRNHINDLYKKDYSKIYPQKTIDCVFMFIPVELFFTTAIMHDNNLIEDALKKNIILVSPIILMTLLKTYMKMWQCYQTTENTSEILKLASELHQGVTYFINDLNNIGKGLKRTVKDYNSSILSLNKKILSTTDKINTLSGITNNNQQQILNKLEIAIK